MHLLAALISGFRDKYPKVDFDLYSATADDIKERIERGLNPLGSADAKGQWTGREEVGESCRFMKYIRNAQKA